MDLSVFVHVTFQYSQGRLALWRWLLLFLLVCLNGVQLWSQGGLYLYLYLTAVILSFLICKKFLWKNYYKGWMRQCLWNNHFSAWHMLGKEMFPSLFSLKTQFLANKINISLACPRSRLSPIIKAWKAKEWSVCDIYISTSIRFYCWC